ncbi:hypothetical protein CAPTEDRAFT_227112 [Capitella teleta]|uniref:Uncharacterized protein n=1 Tax=Capitella teleta TaxID=283909 RepID=R7TES0_CAPTE|nr:hypothetical protein CAPTEDRAFT_227112 [Capitella teleta]|eukprot:ELT89972.1 hypothetical protein CAPTEDRAFT_227112 [Capitella teleta]
MVDRLQNFESRIMEQMKTQMLNTENSEPPSPQKSKRKSPRTKSTAAKGKIFRDGSSILSSLQDVTSSPLFIPPSKIKRKAFRSSAAPIQKSTPESSGDNHDLQQKHNEKILSILNSTKTSEIKKLQTIGQKKADVIVQWTSLNGPLQTFEDLRKAGFSAATVHTFLTKNLVQFG